MITLEKLNIFVAQSVDPLFKMPLTKPSTSSDFVRSKWNLLMVADFQIFLKIIVKKWLSYF